MCANVYSTVCSALRVPRFRTRRTFTHTHTLDSATSKETKDLTGPSSASTMHAELHITAMYAEKSSVLRDRAKLQEAPSTMHTELHITAQCSHLLKP